MKKIFPRYFRPNETEIKQIWSDGLIALDANVLLNLYRYSDETREEFLKIISLFEEKLILPKRAAQEFLANRLGVIVEQENKKGPTQIHSERSKGFWKDLPTRDSTHF